jgi:tRNA/rRNA methyltransferase
VAGTNRGRQALSEGPAIVLVEPQLGENIGTAARAMFNCGLTDLRLVAPRDGWPNDKAVAAASGADAVLERVRLYGRTEDAIADLRHVYVTTARDRHMVMRVLTPRVAAAQMRAAMAGGVACGVLFGPERTGLFNDAIALGDHVIRVPLNPAFASLNLAQAVLLIGYEWFQTGDQTPPNELVTGHSRPATKQELVRFFDHFEEALARSGFLRTAEKRPGMVRNLRNLFQRAECTEQELRTLHGIITAFVGVREKRGGTR